MDYSLPARAIAVGDASFIDALNAAGVQGVVYEMRLGVGAPPPFVGLICSNPQAARTAFKTFQDWTAATDGDAVQLTWYLQPSGKYALVIRADETRLVFRCLGFDRFVQPLLLMAGFVKSIDSTGEATAQFFEYCRGWYHPFFFGAVTMDLVQRRPVPIVSPILKHKAGIVDESRPPAHALDRMILSGTRPAAARRSPPKDKPDPSLRQQLLRQHFPVTLSRIRRAPISHVVEGVLAKGFTRSHLEQAAVNLVLSAQLCDGSLHFQGLTKGALPSAVINAISARFEAADSTDISHLITHEGLARQATFDGNALLQTATSKVGRTPEDVAELLRKKGLMDA